jgi:ABC-type uncharacterized transport system ATPase subunit
MSSEQSPGGPRPVLELRAITKKFGPVVANDRVDFDLLPGEVHALLGENGAGKSTLMSVLYGLYSPTSGEILVDGTPVSIGSPNDAIAVGIGMVHQHFMFIPVMTVAENITLGNEPVRGGPLGVLDRTEARKRVQELSDRFGLDVDPDARIEDVSVGMQQRVEILRALYRGARILVLDEPTAVLTAQEIRDLIVVLHLPQADRGARGGRPHHGAAPRQGHRHCRRPRCYRAVAGPDDRRPRRGLHGREGRPHARITGARGGGRPRAR